MELNEFQELTEAQMSETSAGAIAPYFVAALFTGLAIPVIKNLFIADKANVNLPGGFKLAWDNRDSANIKSLETKMNKLKKMYDEILPPFYEV